MSGPFGSSQFMYATGAEEGQSLRFEDGDSPNLARTVTTAGNRRKFTWSGWVKRGNITGSQMLLMSAGVWSYNNQISHFGIDGSNRIVVHAGVYGISTAYN